MWWRVADFDEAVDYSQMMSVDPSMQSIGLPSDPLASILPPGFQSTQAAIQPAPQITNAQAPSPTGGSLWDSMKSEMGKVISTVETDTENGVKSVYGLGKSAVSTVVGDVTAPIANAATSIYWYALIAVVVVAGAIYFIGKGGAVKVNAIV